MTKSKPAAKGSRGSASSSAKRAFGKSQSLHLNRDPASQSGEREGRKHLSGAFLIETRRIKPDPNQPRKNRDPKAQKELTQSVKRLGILQPITVRYSEEEQCYLIIAGERRFTAATEAGLTEMPCWVQTPNDEDILLHQIVENWQRADLHPFELADSLAQLRDAQGFSQQQIASATGKSKGEISKLMALLSLDPEVQSTARNDTTGKITKRHLYPLTRLEAQQQRKLVQRIENDDLTAADVELSVEKELATQQPAKRGAPVTRRQFKTDEATVVLTFRKKEVSDTDILAAIEEVKADVEGQAEENENSA